MADEPIGKITHYFNKIQVAVIKLENGELKKGDKIKIVGHGKEFEQDVTSMQVEHKEIETAPKGSEFGMKMNEDVKPGDLVYKI
jgi:putative protease